MHLTTNFVNEDDKRSGGAGTPNKCFYCKGLFGKEHDADCVCLKRAVKIRLTLELIVALPRSWSKEDIEFRYNESSYCLNNIVDDINRHCKADACLCPLGNVDYVGEASIEEAEEVGLTDKTND